MTTHSTKDYGDDSDNKLAEHVSTASLENVPTITRTRREPPELIKNMSLEERQLIYIRIYLSPVNISCKGGLVGAASALCT